jgi:hypothetical protein
MLSLAAHLVASGGYELGKAGFTVRSRNRTWT